MSLLMYRHLKMLYNLRLGFNMSMINYAKLAIAGDAGKYVGIGSNYEKKSLEKVGNTLLTPAQELPKTVVNLSRWGFNWTVKQMCDPNVITVGLTATAMIGGTFAFYPEFSRDKSAQLFNIAGGVAQTALKFVGQYITRDSVKLVGYTALASCILGLGTRTLGRFQNPRLIDVLTRQQLPSKIVPQNTQDLIGIKKS